MSNNVFANGRELACKAGSGKSIAAFPDVCMTPPENPATPPGVPVPYPNTGMASDTTAGSTTVKISGKEVMLKNKSHYKQSSGDEAGAAAKKGVISSTNRGKVYFAAWSMDVRIEGENVVRHLDLTTHNHGSAMNGGITVDAEEATMAEAPEHECHNGTSLPPDQQCASHTLLCNKRYCDACIDRRDPKCADEAAAEQAAYDREQAKPPQQRAQSALFEQLDKAWDEIDRNLGAKPGKGPMFELQVIQAYQERDDLVAIGFWAHCSTCHVLIEIDIVTKDHIMEVKSPDAGFTLEQMKKYQQALDQCPELAGKKIGLITSGENAKLQHDVRATARNFGRDGIRADPFCLVNNRIVPV